jgi:3-hydroxybutyryl-CoA dehydrogenase
MNMNKIQKIGIIGSGKMGSDIFNYLTDYNYNLIWFTRNDEHKNILRDTFEKKIKRQLKHGIISENIFELRNSFKITSQLTELSDCDLIIESVIEDQTIKTELFKTIETIVKPSCILVSNSSSIVPSIYSEELKRPTRIAGIHFFYPMAIKNITELIFSGQTDELTKESLRLFLESIKRFTIEQDEQNAFMLNRFLLEIQIKAYELHQSLTIDFKEIDEIAKRIIPDFGLFEVVDQVGHQTMYNSILNYSLMDVNKAKYQPLLAELNNRLTTKQNNQKLFCDPDSQPENHDKRLHDEIYNTLKDHINETIKRYSVNFNLNIFTFSKALNEFCGIIV